MTTVEKVTEVERGIHTCQHEKCKTDATYKVITIETNGNEGTRKATYLCRKHFEHEHGKGNA